MASSASKEISLAGVPAACISSICWTSPTSLVGGFWDSSVRLFDVKSNDGVKGTYHHKAPVLDVCPGPGQNSVISGGLDMDVRLHDFTNGSDIVLGSHTEPVRSVLYDAETKLCISGSWDKTVRCWDTTSSTSSSSTSSSSSLARQVAKVDVPNKVYSMTQAGQSLLVATAGRQILTYDIRKLAGGAVGSSSSSSSNSDQSQGGALLSAKESSLKHQTRCIRAAPGGGNFAAISSTEGRVAIDYFAEDAAANSYAFKCHRKKEADGSETVFPVHSLSFHPVYSTFATGGGDGNVFLWDAKGRKRLAGIGPYQNSIGALAFSPDGTYLAIAATNDSVDDGASSSSTSSSTKAPDAIFVRTVDVEAKPKATVGK